MTRAAPRPVECVIAHRHRDRAVADDACAGRFTAAGVTLDLGLDPDWLLGGLADDEEWRIEWSKFSFGLDLAWAHGDAADARYLQAWERLVTSWLHQVPPDHDPSEVVARRLQNWVYAWQAFEAAGGRRPSEAFGHRLLDGIAAQLAYLRANLTAERNHRTLELYALLVVGLALPELDSALAASSWEQMQDNLATDVLADGVHNERSTHYHLIALRSFLGARLNACRYGLPVPRSYEDALRRACRFALHVNRPDGLVPALSDGDVDDHRDVLALAGDLLEPRAELAVSFDVGGYHVQRSSWEEGTDARFLLLDAGPLGDGGHGHYDALSFEAYGRGRPLVVDPGRYTYSEAGANWRRWFKSTAAHNTVTVDGMDQTPYRRGKPKPADVVCRARLLRRDTAGGLDVLRAEARSPCYDAVHTRTVAFVAGEYWVVHDRLDAPTPHDYGHHLHLPADAWRRVDVVVRPGDVVVEAPGMAVLYPGGARPRVRAGWVSPTYGVRQRAPVVSVCRSARAGTSFLCVLWPRDREHGPPPRLSVVRRDRGVTALLVAGVGPEGTATDHLVWSAEPAEVELGPLRVRTTIGWVRTDATGAIASQAFPAGSA